MIAFRANVFVSWHDDYLFDERRNRQVCAPLLVANATHVPFGRHEIRLPDVMPLLLFPRDRLQKISDGRVQIPAAQPRAQDAAASVSGQVGADII
jgi:hypothetical protein